jgi:hypothetical protein
MTTWRLSESTRNLPKGKEYEKNDHCSVRSNGRHRGRRFCPKRSTLCAADH